jgi:hypothetical protein
VKDMCGETEEKRWRDTVQHSAKQCLLFMGNCSGKGSLIFGANNNVPFVPLPPNNTSSATST